MARAPVMPIQKHTNCLVRAVSFYMYNTEDWFYEIRLSTMNKIINEWKYYKDIMVDLSMVNSAEDYKNFLSRDEEYGESVKLACISCLFSNYS